MLSDEEKVGDTYVRHQPSFRSERLNKFIQKLDERIDNTPTTHPRHPRLLGSPVARPVPEHAKPWMLADPPSMPEEDDHTESQELNRDIISDCDSEGSDTY